MTLTANENDRTVILTFMVPDNGIVPDQLTDLFTTALEGGIGYWSACSRYKWECDYEDRHAIISEACDPDTSKQLRVTPETMLKGLIELARHRPTRRTSSGSTFLTMLVTLGTDDFPDYDAGDADVIVQFGLGLTWVDSTGKRQEIYG